MDVPLEQVRVEGEEAVQRVGVGGHTVSSCRAADHRQHVAVVPFYDGVAEHHLVLPATKAQSRILYTLIHVLINQFTKCLIRWPLFALDFMWDAHLTAMSHFYVKN